MSNDKLEATDTSEPTEQSSHNQKESLRLSLIDQHRLKNNSTLDQIEVWLRAKDFEKHESFLRLHFIDCLNHELRRRSVSPFLLKCLLGRPHFSVESNWSEIHSLIISLSMNDLSEAVIDDQDELAESLGFPPETFGDMMNCVEQGMGFEARIEVRKKVFGHSTH